MVKIAENLSMWFMYGHLYGYDSKAVHKHRLTNISFYSKRHFDIHIFGLKSIPLKMWPLAVDSIILKSTLDTKNDKNIFQEAVLIDLEHLELCQSTLVYDYSSY